MNIPFNVTFHFDERLRDIPNHQHEVVLAVDWLKAQLKKTADTKEQIQLLGLMGVYSRQLMDLDTAQASLSSALRLSKQVQDSRLQVANSIRLAHVYQWQQRYADSEQLFEQVIARIQQEDAVSDYLDFAYQHAGKCKFDQQDYESARLFFEKALSIRLCKKDSCLIESSQWALEVTDDCLN